MLISVIIPCYNVEQYIEDCIQAVLAQTYSHTEIIAIDDCSTDSTYQKLLLMEKKVPGKLIVKRNPGNKGASYSRNVGLQFAKGDYIQFLDADDLLLPDKISHQVALVSPAGELVLLTGNYVRQRTDGTTIEKTFGDTSSPWYGLINSTLGITSANLWPAKPLREIGGWNDALKSSQEYDLMFRLLQHNIPVKYDPAFLTVVRERESGSISQVNLGENWKRYIDLRVKVLKYLSENGLLTPGLKDAALQRIFEAVRVLYRYDRGAALAAYYEHIYKKYSPRPSLWVTRNYLLLYRLLGFKAAEKMKSILKQ